MKNNKNILTMIKDKNNPSIKNTMIKTKFKKKGSNKD